MARRLTAGLTGRPMGCQLRSRTQNHGPYGVGISTYLLFSRYFLPRNLFSSHFYGATTDNNTTTPTMNLHTAAAALSPTPKATPAAPPCPHGRQTMTVSMARQAAGGLRSFYCIRTEHFALDDELQFNRFEDSRPLLLTRPSSVLSPSHGTERRGRASPTHSTAAGGASWTIGWRPGV